MAIELKGTGSFAAYAEAEKRVLDQQMSLDHLPEVGLISGERVPVSAGEDVNHLQSLYPNKNIVVYPYENGGLQYEFIDRDPRQYSGNENFYDQSPTLNEDLTSSTEQQSPPLIDEVNNRDTKQTPKPKESGKGLKENRIRQSENLSGLTGWWRDHYYHNGVRLTNGRNKKRKR